MPVGDVSDGIKVVADKDEKGGNIKNTNDDGAVGGLTEGYQPRLDRMQFKKRAIKNASDTE